MEGGEGRSAVNYGFIATKRPGEMIYKKKKRGGNHFLFVLLIN